MRTEVSGRPTQCFTLEGDAVNIEDAFIPIIAFLYQVYSAVNRDIMDGNEDCLQRGRWTSVYVLRVCAFVGGKMASVGVVILRRGIMLVHIQVLVCL